MKHTYYSCGGKCRDEGHCQYCDGGLARCTTCGGAEGSLTTDCPGRKVTAVEEDAIYNQGTLDYRDDWFWYNPACNDLFGRPIERWRALRFPAAHGLPPRVPGRRLHTDCSVCGQPQFDTASGITCQEGHGGAPAREPCHGCPNVMCSFPDCPCGRVAP